MIIASTVDTGFRLFAIAMSRMFVQTRLVVARLCKITVCAMRMVTHVCVMQTRVIVGFAAKT